MVLTDIESEAGVVPADGVTANQPTVAPVSIEVVNPTGTPALLRLTVCAAGDIPLVVWKLNVKAEGSAESCGEATMVRVISSVIARDPCVLLAPGACALMKPEYFPTPREPGFAVTVIAPVGVSVVPPVGAKESQAPPL